MHVLRVAAVLAAFIVGAGVAMANTPGTPPGAPVPPPLPAGPPPLPPQTPVTPAQAPEWYVGLGGGQQGPFTLDQVGAKVTAKEVTALTLVWNPRLPNWTAAAQVAELKPFFAQLGPPPLTDGDPLRQLNEQIKAFMVGEWKSSGPFANMPGAFQTTVIRYNADGSFSGFQSIQYAGMETPMALTGRWTVTAITATKFTFTANFQGGLAPSTAVWNIVDDNTLQNERDGAIVQRTAR